MEKPELRLLPLVCWGVAGGIYKYFIKEPIHRAIESWIDGHAMSQAEFDKYIGEQALSFGNSAPIIPGKIDAG